MKTNEYKAIKERYDSILVAINDLEFKISNCKDDEAIKLLRADYRAYQHEKTIIYEQLIAVKP